MKYVIVFTLILFSMACASNKLPDNNWADKKWVLMELRGAPVQISGTDKDAHLVFAAPDKRFFGSGGCNRINGAYTMAKKGRLSFSEPMSTRMSCPDLAFESSFLATLKEVDRFSVLDNTLHLMKGNEVLMKLK